MTKTLLVTGGAGFIGSCFVAQRLQKGDKVINLDALTYAGSLENVASAPENPNYTFVHGNIRDLDLVVELLKRFRPDAIVSFAAETHVDRSIVSAPVFIETNVGGTERLLASVLKWREDKESFNPDFRYIQISTDEVYGSANPNSPPFTEESPLNPSNPYSASKAGSDLMVKAFHKTYGIDTLITRCTNNYGPRQFPEKLIPHLISNALSGKKLPIYGQGLQRRNWLFVADCCEGISSLVDNQVKNRIFNISGKAEKSNIEVVKALCKLLDKLSPSKSGASYADQIVFVKDRPGHDFLYSIDDSRIKKETGWEPRTTFEEGLEKTVKWFLEHPARLQVTQMVEIEFWKSH